MLLKNNKMLQLMYLQLFSVGSNDLCIPLGMNYVESVCYDLIDMLVPVDSTYVSFSCTDDICLPIIRKQFNDNRAGFHEDDIS
jgi:hypothetical protein